MRQNISSLLLLSSVLIAGVTCQLVINVSSGEADANVVKQTVTGNTTAETVTISFLTAAGTAVTQLTDFRSGVTLTSVTILGEQELGEPPYQRLCFVTPGTGDMIPPEAVNKLRQKHPGAVRVAEESRGRVVIDNTATLNINKAQYLSSHIYHTCKDARETTFVPQHLISQFKEGVIGVKKGLIRKETSYFSPNEGYTGQKRCAQVSTSDLNTPCVCVVDTCVHWYPCSLKYCRNNGPDAGEHRCGIRTCSKCSEMRFTATNKMLCSWDSL